MGASFQFDPTGLTAALVDDDNCQHEAIQPDLLSGGFQGIAAALHWMLHRVY
jgi:hypothetical protein